MAIVVEQIGNQVKISGQNDPKYGNGDDLEVVISGDNVGIFDNSDQDLIINDDYTEYGTPSGGTPEDVADAISAIIAAAASGGGEIPQDSVIVDPSTAGGELTPIPANALSVELLAADATNVLARIRNDGTGILYITEGDDATADSANKLLQDDVYNVTSELVVNGIWVGVNGQAVINKNTK